MTKQNFLLFKLEYKFFDRFPKISITAQAVKYKSRIFIPSKQRSAAPTRVLDRLSIFAHANGVLLCMHVFILENNREKWLSTGGCLLRELRHQSPFIRLFFSLELFKPRQETRLAQDQSTSPVISGSIALFSHVG